MSELERIMTARSKELGFASIEDALKMFNDCKGQDEKAPQVFVQSSSQINIGGKIGDWFDLESISDYEEFVKVCNTAHLDEPNPTLMVTDWRNLPEKFHKASLKEVWDELQEWLELSEHEREVVSEYWDEVDEEMNIRGILDRYAYDGDSDDYFDMQAEEMMDEYKVPDFIRDCFDFEKWRKQCEWDYIVTSNYVFYN